MAVLSAVAGLALAALATRNMVANYDWGGEPFGTWDAATFNGCLLGSCAALAVCGPWLTWRLPGNRTGRRLALLGASLALWTASVFWVAGFASLSISLVSKAFRPLLFLAVLAWPSGRLEARWERRYRILVVLSVLLFVARGFLVGVEPRHRLTGIEITPLLPDGVVGIFDHASVFLLVQGPAVAVLIAVIRMHRRGAATTSWSARIALAAGITAAFGDIWIVFTGYVTGSGTVWQMLRLSVDFARFGLVGVLLVAAEFVARRSTSRAENAPTVVELGLAGERGSAEQSFRDMVHDPSASVLWPGADDQSARDARRGRRVVAIADDAGEPVADLEFDERIVLPTHVLDAIAARLRLRLIKESWTAAAVAREAELHSLQRALIDAQDHTRRSVERDLHDGAQQRLLGLALEMQLVSRSGTDVSRGDMASALDGVAQDLVSLARGRLAAVVDGLAAGLATLAATTPLPTRLVVDGDVDPSSAMCAAAWFVANDSVANALKHANAMSLTIRLAVGDDITVEVTDDGVGGLADVPGSLARRVSACGGSIRVAERPPHGARLTARLPLAASVEVSA